jgi:hypothetical protein
MTRTFANNLAFALFRHAASEKYPTRTVEHMLAWMLVVWSAAVAYPSNMMVGKTFAYLIAIAPEWWWGWSGILLGSARLFALYLNGNWRRSPGLRFIGAMMGLIWWLILSACYWVSVVRDEAPDFPMRYVFFVFIFFEGYSCFRCGQDHASPKARDASENG